MKFDLLHLATKITNEEYVKIILSSGDYYPGFYRFTMGDRNFEDGQLSIKGLVRAYFEQMSLDKTYSRKEWTAFTHKRLTPQDERSKERTDFSVYELLEDKYKQWQLTPKEYDIAVIDIDCGVQELQLDQTYFFMGSLIRLTHGKFLIGYDYLRDTWLEEISVDTDAIISYTKSIYATNHKEFFLPADLIASVAFNDQEQGNITMTDDSLSRAVTSDANNIVIASNRDVSSNIPIRWAKDILLSEIGQQ